METNGRFYAEVSDLASRARALQNGADVYRTLHEAKPCPKWRSALAAQLRSIAEQLEPQALPKEVL